MRGRAEAERNPVGQGLAAGVAQPQSGIIADERVMFETAGFDAADEVFEVS
jgi:hypothetical protein